MNSATVILILALASALASGKFAHAAEPTPREAIALCAHASQNESDWNQTGNGDLDQWFVRHGVAPVTRDMDRKYLVQFALELSKFPEPLLARIYDAHGRINLLQGRGVSEDPSWTTSETTPDGRTWKEVPGAGGAPYASWPGHESPTRIVVNRLYEGHGSVNLVLHEHAHAMDSIAKYQGLSGSSTWRMLVDESPDFLHFLQDNCGEYCVNNYAEGFAEAFAHFYACPASRKIFEKKAPKVAQFFGELPGKNLSDFK